jgi:hypothetical protein
MHLTPLLAVPMCPVLVVVLGVEGWVGRQGVKTSMSRASWHSCKPDLPWDILHLLKDGVSLVCSSLLQSSVLQLVHLGVLKSLGRGAHWLSGDTAAPVQQGEEQRVGGLTQAS